MGHKEIAFGYLSQNGNMKRMDSGGGEGWEMDTKCGERLGIQTYTYKSLGLVDELQHLLPSSVLFFFFFYLFSKSLPPFPKVLDLILRLCLMGENACS